MYDYMENCVKNESIYVKTRLKNEKIVEKMYICKWFLRICVGDY